jgi:hypothetical protein
MVKMGHYQFDSQIRLQPMEDIQKTNRVGPTRNGHDYAVARPEQAVFGNGAIDIPNDSFHESVPQGRTVSINTYYHASA